jgi:hypothetical protein
LCQADKWLDAKQVGIYLRLLRQELVKGQHSVCSRQDALSVAHVASWRLLGVVVGSQVVSEPHLPQEWHRRSFYYPLTHPYTDTAKIPPLFSSHALRQNFILTGKRPVQWLAKNATRPRIKEKVGTAFWVDGLPLRASIKEKVGKYRKVVQALKLPFVVCIIPDFGTGRGLDDLEDAVLGRLRCRLLKGPHAGTV